MPSQPSLGTWVAIAVTVILTLGTFIWAARLFRTHRRRRRAGGLDGLRNPAYIVLALGFFFLGGIVWQLIDVFAQPFSFPTPDPGEDETFFYPIAGVVGDPSEEGGVLFAAQGGLWRVAPGPDDEPASTGAVTPGEPELVMTEQRLLNGLAQLPDGTILASGWDEETDAALGLIQSRDGGATWSTVSLAGEAVFRALAPATVDGRVLYGRQVLDDNEDMPAGVYRSDDGGRQWEPVSLAGIPEDAVVTGLAALGPDQPVVGTDQGLYRSDDAGQTWESVMEEVVVTALHHSPAHPGQVLVYAVGEDNTGGLQLWDAASDTFTPLPLVIPPGDTVMFLGRHPADENTIFAATFLSELWGSFDGGNTWHALLPEGALWGEGLQL